MAHNVAHIDACMLVYTPQQTGAQTKAKRRAHSSTQSFVGYSDQTLAVKGVLDHSLVQQTAMHSMLET